MAYLILASKQDAIKRSREAWEAILGRKKRPEDISEFLWDIEVSKDGRAALVISHKTELLTLSENTAKTETLDTNWEKPVLKPLATKKVV